MLQGLHTQLVKHCALLSSVICHLSSGPVAERSVGR